MRRSCVPDKKKRALAARQGIVSTCIWTGCCEGFVGRSDAFAPDQGTTQSGCRGGEGKSGGDEGKDGAIRGTGTQNRDAEQGRKTGTKKNRSCDRFFPKIIRRLLGRSGFSRLCISGRSGSVSRLSVSSRSSGVSRLGSVSSRSGVSRLCISSRSSSGRSFSSRSSCRCRSFFLLAASSQGNSQQRSDQQSLFHEYSFNI